MVRCDQQEALWANFENKYDVEMESLQLREHKGVAKILALILLRSPRTMEHLYVTSSEDFPEMHVLVPKCL